MGIICDWLQRALSRAGAEEPLPQEGLLGTEGWRQGTQTLSRDTEEVFVVTAQRQDAIFQVSLGLTGAPGEAVLEPDPDSAGEVRIKRCNSLPIILDERARTLIMERVELPISHTSIPVIKVSARILLKKKTVVNRSIPLWKLQAVYVLSIEELYDVASYFENAKYRDC